MSGNLQRGGGGGGGSGDDTPTDDPDGGLISWDRIQMPAWLESLSSLSAFTGTLRSFAKSPAKFVRGIIAGWLLGGVGNILAPIFESIQVLLVGTAPATLAAPGETWGLVDIPVGLAKIAGSTGSALIGLVFDAVSGVISAAVPTTSGPVEGLLATVVIAMIVVVVVRVGVPVLQIVLEAVPVIGGPISTLLDELL